MKNTNKKRGFTIVELVIVIAVIAILAAVMIPTFVGLVDKANVSADEQAVKQMNTALAADGAVEPTTIFELYNVLSENGFNAENYSALAKNKFFFWDPTEGVNKILYTEYEGGNYTVLGPADQLNNANQDKWVSLNGKLAEVAAPVVTNTGDVEVATAEEFLAVAKAFQTGNYAVKNIVFTAAEYNFMGAELYLYNNVDGNGRKLLNSDITITGKAGGTTLSGIVNLKAARESGVSSSGIDRTYCSGMIGYTNGFDVTIKDITVDNSVFGSNEIAMSAVFVAQANRGSEVKFENVDVTNTTVRGLNKTGIFVGQLNVATVTIDADCSADANTTVEVVAGLAGRVFGLLYDGTANVTTPAAFDNVKVELKKVPGGNYIKVGNIEYGADLEKDLTIKVNETGKHEYLKTIAKYGFEMVKKDNYSEIVPTEGSLSNGVTKALDKYDAIEWAP